MATLRFNGTSSYMYGVGHGAMQRGTMAALIRRTKTAGDIIQPRPGFGWCYGNTNKMAYYAGSVSEGPTVVGASDWYLLVMTYPAPVGGTLWTPRHHIKNITTGAAWIHENGSSQASGPPNSAVGAQLKIAEINIFDWFGGDIALVGWWDGTTLTDLQVESLAANLKTSDWNALSPSSLTEMRSLTPTDLKGLETWTLGASTAAPTLAGADPPGWTFGLAAPQALTGGGAIASAEAFGAGLLEAGVPTMHAVRMLTSDGWLNLGPGVGYYTSANHLAGTTISIPQTRHRLRPTRGLQVTIHNEATGMQEVADVNVTTGGDVTVTFVSSATANSKRVTIMGPMPNA